MVSRAIWKKHAQVSFSKTLSPFSTRRLFSREATFSFVGVAYHISKRDADKGKSRFARKKSPSGKRALNSSRASDFVLF